MQGKDSGVFLQPVLKCDVASRLPHVFSESKPQNPAHIHGEALHKV